MVLFMKDSSITVLDQDTVNGNQVKLRNQLMNIKANTKAIKKMDLVNTDGQMVLNIKDTLKMI
jgi:hypothetical protein